jgi:glycosyltransferase involved in cell wall biosynthesis
MSTIAAVIIGKDEKEKIADCIRSVEWANEVLYFDNESTDNTLDVVKKTKAKIHYLRGGDFASRKNNAFKKVKQDYILSIDADERITPELKFEILGILKKPNDTNSAYAIPRKNIILGKHLTHGGWWPDFVIRLYKKNDFREVQGELHEQPTFSGKLGYLKNPIVHHKHDNLSEMVDKTNIWSGVEARLMYDANHPPMNLIRFATAGMREFWLRMISKQGFLDGTEGVIYSLYQVISRLLSYSKLWEMQINKREQLKS